MYQLEELAAARRNNEPIEAMVRSVGNRKMPVKDDKTGEVSIKEAECAIFELPGGVKGLCPNFEFSEHNFNSLVGFVGTVHAVTIMELDLDSELAIVSVKRADAIKKEAFWNEIESLEESNSLQEKVYEGIVTGFNIKSQTIFVKVEGQDCFVKRNDWDHSPVRNMEEEIERNSKVDLKIVRFDKENGLVQASRKAAIDDPFNLLKQFVEDDACVGAVTAVHPIHGIYVQVVPGLQIKASKPKELLPPIVGDIVQLRIMTIDEEKRRARSVIIGYPQGKKKMKDVGSFLYE